MNTEIKFVDTTVRDGNQSLWALNMRVGVMLTALPALDAAGFEALEFMYRQLGDALEKIHFLYGDKADSLMHAVRHLLGKARLSRMEVKLLLGLARQIRWYVEQNQRQ